MELTPISIEEIKSRATIMYLEFRWITKGDLAWIREILSDTLTLRGRDREAADAEFLRNFPDDDPEAFHQASLYLLENLDAIAAANKNAVAVVHLDDAVRFGFSEEVQETLGTTDTVFVGRMKGSDSEQ